MDKCLLVKRSWASGGLRISDRLYRALPTSPPSAPFPSLLARSFSRVLVMASSEDFGLRWQPAFRFEQAELMEDAPSLLRTCRDFDWKAHASELRALAQLSLIENPTANDQQTPYSSNASTPPKVVGDSTGEYEGYMWFGVGLALATATLFQFSFHFSALAAEVSAQTNEVSEAATRAPAWLTPTLLAFPVVSYAIFYVYRSQVNPNAKVTDWMFSVAATVIIANLILISTIGVRLY